MPRLEGRVAIVTGGAKGNGRAICERFVEEGATVVIADVDAEGGRRTAEELGRDGSTAVFEAMDVTDDDSVRDTIATVVARFGRLDIMVNNAGVLQRRTPTDVDELELDDFLRVMAVNVTGVFLCMKHALRHMKPQGSGSIINLSSTAGMKPGPGGAAYCSSKSTVLGLTKTVALEVAAKGIRVNAICPGMIDTPMMDQLIDDMDAQGQDGRAIMSTMQPIGRLGRPREIGDAAVFLASDESSLITGIPLVVDGGFLAG
jgi:NAD(P)-dependent dehydrogenase (short-subunit alcohol dehydrogenase family)